MDEPRSRHRQNTENNSDERPLPPDAAFLHRFALRRIRRSSSLFEGFTGLLLVRSGCQTLAGEFLSPTQHNATAIDSAGNHRENSLFLSHNFNLTIFGAQTFARKTVKVARQARCSNR